MYRNNLMTALGNPPKQHLKDINSFSEARAKSCCAKNGHLMGCIFMLSGNGLKIIFNTQFIREYFFQTNVMFNNLKVLVNNYYSICSN